MKTYSQKIEDTELISFVETCTTTGDLDYDGTAMEITSSNNRELFHVIVDSKGIQQVLFWEHKTPFRMNLKDLENIITRAKEVVHSVK